MVVVIPPAPALSPDVVSLFYVVDELLSRSPLVIFYGPSATPTAAANNSRIQAHVFSPAGFQSYQRLTIAPSSPLYAAVNCLPREEQGDDVCRGLAFSLYKYFAELPPHVKALWDKECAGLAKLRNAPALFSEGHAALLASRMSKVENVADVIKDVRQALAEHSVSWLDLDVVLPSGALNDISKAVRESAASELTEDELAVMRYGEYAQAVRLFGDVAFLPTSRLKRAPSRPTALNRSGTFTKKQKESIRREMCELLDTEESYVMKLTELVHNVAIDFREKATARSPTSASPTADALAGLFPASLDRILSTNSSFLELLRKAVEDTENDAIQDIESTNDEPYAASSTDLTGCASLAACLGAWFPKFSECYVDYTQAHAKFPHYLRYFTKDSSSSFSSRVQETGEQRLMSMLIEPVQRLPRYNLYIDNIIKQLPAKHSAIKPLLKARDIISEICSQDSAASPSLVVDHLRRMIPSWPLSFRPAGRLVSAVDAAELPAPYRQDLAGPRVIHCILLIFTDCLVMLKKLPRSSMTARGLLAQLDGQDTSFDARADELMFREKFDLHSFGVTEMDHGKMIQIFLHQSLSKLGRPGSRPGSISAENPTLTFSLGGVHEGKASRFVEELTKARVEGRYSEPERDGAKWEVRCANGVDLTFFVAMSEEDNTETFPGRGHPGRMRLCLAPEKCKKPAVVGADVYAALSIQKNGFYQLQISGPSDFSSKDNLTAVEFLPVLTKRLSNVLQMSSQIKNQSMTKILLFRNQHILQSLKIVTSDMVDGPKDRLKTSSPVKMFASLFGGAISRDNSHRKTHHSSLSLTDIPNLSHPSSGRKSDERRIEPTNTTNSASLALERLEDTLSSYILSLHARKGNVVGKVLRLRAQAEELAVNELYNHLLEDPSNLQLAAQVPIDVLFCAFEKFVRNAWQDKMGPIISQQAWHDIQSKLDSWQPGEFEESFRHVFSEMSPQNQRGLTALIKLLVDLLEGTGNDGDRGILTASFAELLAPDGHPHEFVSLLDRLVEDIDPLLLGKGQSAFGAVNSESKHYASSSMNSNSSSLRKKFGLLRKGSKTQSDDSESTSVWRSLSKSKHGLDSSPSSLSKASSFNRSKSTDVTGQMSISPKRPSSRDRPTILGAFSFEARPLTTIGEGQISGPPRKKRRSSLSDLPSIQNSGNNTPAFANTPSKSPGCERESPRTPSRSLIPQPSPTQQARTMRSISPMRRENSPTRSIPRAASPPKSRPTSSSAAAAAAAAGEVAITAHQAAANVNMSPRRRNTAGSSIPTLRSAGSSGASSAAGGSSSSASAGGGLSERPTSGNVRRLPPPPGHAKSLSVSDATLVAPLNPAAGRLRLQGSTGPAAAAGGSPGGGSSPHRLRERLAAERAAVDGAASSLQAELGRIGAEVAASSASGGRVGASAARALEARLATVAGKHAALATAIKARVDALAGEAAASDARARQFERLYREANAENEALYARFNEELARMAGAVAAGRAEGEVARRCKALEEEGEKVRRENARLRKEVAGLKALVRE